MVSSSPRQASAPALRFSRRHALLGGGLAAAATVAHRGTSATHQIDLGTPEAPAPALAADTPALGITIAAKAAELEYDQERIFRFVADDVRYEPYAGNLRGAEGTLWSLAGNSVDKTLLLAALFDEALIDYRYAFGPLDAAGEQSLSNAILTDPEHLNQSITQAQINGFTPTPSSPLEPGQPATPAPELTPAQQQAVDDLIAASSEIIQRATELGQTQFTLVENALTTAGIDLPAPAFTLPETEISRHAWLQVADGPAWVDYAPAIAGTPSGTAPATPAETVEELPADLAHTITIRIVAEEYIGGSNLRRDAINVPFTSAELVNEPVAILVVPPNAVANIGFTLNEALTGVTAYVPALLAKGIGSFADAPLTFGSGGGLFDAFAAEPGEEQAVAEGETLALWLAIDIASPGAEPVTIERVLYDRIGFEARQAGTIDFSVIEPVTMVTDAEGQDYVSGLTPAYLLSVDSAHIPASYAMQDAERRETFGDLALINPGILTLRDGLRQALELPENSLSWISSPQITLVTAKKQDAEDLTSGMVVELDLMHHHPSTFPLGGNAGTKPGILAGVADQVAEQVTIETAASSTGNTGNVAFGATVGSIFAAAGTRQIDIETLATPADLSRIRLEPEATHRIEQALDSGFIVIVPRESVELDGVPRSGWWLVDPVTGAARDELDTGKGGASFTLTGLPPVRPATFEEETFVIRLGTTASQYYRALGFKVFCLAMFGLAGIGIGFALANGAVGGSSMTSAGAAGAATGAAGAAAIGGC